jgi:tripartite ATP-independent transporter DctM subunit
MTAESATILLFGSMVFFLILGLPFVFTLGGVAMLGTILLWGPQALPMLPSKAFGNATSFTMVAGPLFVFMAIMLQRAGIAEALFSAIHRWMGPVRGGLAIGTVIICTIFAAMSGISAVGTVTMGLIALPEMLKRKYDKSMSLGCIAAGGALGQLIPPSIIFIVYALFAPESVGALYLGGIIPGLLLSALFILYIIIRCFFQPKLGPPLPLEERASIREKFNSLKGVILPILLVVAVLGSMFTGFASVTEAAAVGAAGSVISAAVYGRLRWDDVKKSLIQTVGLMGMVMWIIFGASAFTGLYGAIDAMNMVQEIMMALPGGKWGVIITINLILVIMGCFLDPYGILMITVPIFVPVIKAMGFSPVWFGVIFVMNMEMGFLTPPFGYNLFYLKSVAPEGVTMEDIYKSISPFVGLQAIGLAAVIIFPELALWLPSQVKF